MSKKLNKIILFGIIIGFFIILQGFTEILTPAISKFHHITDDDIIQNNNDKIKASGYWNLTNSRIFIDDSDPNYNWSKTASENDWCSGSGTWIDPYIIENITIDAQNNGSCIEIKNSDVPFIIRNCSLYNSGYLHFLDRGAGIKFDYVSNGKILKNNLSNNSRTDGIHLYISDNNTISGNILNNNCYGLYVSSSDDNNILNNTIENNEKYGCYLEFGKNNTFSNNNLSSCGFGMEGPLNYVSSHHITTSNLVNRKPIYYYINNISLSPIDFLNAGQVILVNCRKSLVSNINVSYSSCGIGLYYCEEITLTLINSSYCAERGIYLRDSDYNTIYKNVIEWNGHQSYMNDRGGIALSLSSYNNITENQAHHNSKGIHMQLGQNNILVNNSANFNSRCGIHLDSSNANLTENDMKKCGIEINRYASTYFIDGTNLVNEKLVYFYKNKNGLSPDDFLNAGQVILVNCNDTEIYNVNVTHGSCGIYISNCYNVNIEKCNSSYNSIIGIKFFGHNSTLSNNIIKNNYEKSLEVSGNGNLIINNEIEGNKWETYPRKGLEVRGDFNNVINNSIKYHYFGIFLSYSSNNYFIGNIIQNNSKYGIIIFNTIYKCVNNTLFNNYFINNSINAQDDSLPNHNHWDNGSLGNYWDDYSGIDLNDDKIGDFPYNISGDAGSKDFFPIWDDGDDGPPAITIKTPIQNEIFGLKPPELNLEIIELELDEVWYSINNGTIFLSNYTYTGKIMQSIWDQFGNGSIVIKVYANDTLGQVGMSSIQIRKDIIAPHIIINFPTQNQEYNNTAPFFDLSIIEGNLAYIWYTIDNGLTNITCGTSGQIDQTHWDALPEGEIVIIFYANDSIGNGAYAEISVVKRLSQQPIEHPLGIPGYNLYILIGIISIISIIIVKRRFK